MSGLWADADEANKASIKQITGGKTMAQTYTPPKKPWNQMTDEEQRADIAARMATKGGKDIKRETQARVVEPTCYHDGSIGGFTLLKKAITISGAKAYQLKVAPKDTKLVIDLSGGQVKLETKPWVVDAPPLLSHLKVPPPAPPDILRLDWPDRQEPRCDIDWWRTLLDNLVTHYNGSRIIVSCMGSHGRTGTMMACLILTANPSISVENTIKFVRKHHCYKAIESDDQIDYLRLFRPKEDSKWFDTAASDSFPLLPRGGHISYYGG